MLYLQKNSVEFPFFFYHVKSLFLSSDCTVNRVSPQKPRENSETERTKGKKRKSEGNKKNQQSFQTSRRFLLSGNCTAGEEEMNEGTYTHRIDNRLIRKTVIQTPIRNRHRECATRKYCSKTVCLLWHFAKRLSKLENVRQKRKQTNK